MKLTKAEKTWWAIAIGAVIAIPSLIAVNLLWNEALALAIFSGVDMEMWKLFVILGSEFIVLTLSYAALVKAVFFD